MTDESQSGPLKPNFSSLAWSMAPVEDLKGRGQLKNYIKEKEDRGGPTGGSVAGRIT